MAADGAVNIDVGLNIDKADKELEKLKQKISRLETEVNKDEETRNGLKNQIKEVNARLDEATEKVIRLKDEYNSTRGFEKASIKGQLTEALDEQRRLNTEAQSLDREYDRVKNRITDGTSKLRDMRDEAGELEGSIARVKPMANLSKALDTAKAKLLGFAKVALGVTTAIAVFKKLKSAIVDAVKEFAQYDEETQNSINGLKTSLQTLKMSWGAAFAPILNDVAPILQKLIAWLTTAANAVQQFFNVLSGKSTYKAVKANEALADSYGAAGGAAEKASKQLMGFDEINKLSDNESGGGGGGSQNAYEIEELPISDKFQTIAQMVKDNLAAIEFTLGTSLLGLGAILAFSGANIPLGLGLMALGALSLGKSITENWSGVSDRIKSSVFEIATIIGLSLMAVGAILAFSGANIPLGIGLMAAGAISVGAVALNWGNMTANIQKNVADIMAVLTGALLAVGALLAFSGVNVPLGIGLMLAGGLSLATAVALNWNRLPQMLRGPLGLITTIAGGFLLALGLVLALSSASVGLGVGLMALGGATLYAGATNFNWTGLFDKVKEAWKAIKDYYNENIAKYFTLSYWQDKLDSVFGKIQFPQIKLPHVTVTWEAASGWMAQALNFFGIPASLPHIAVDWYAKGGIVDGATLIGAGEAGKEAIVPLEKNTGWINMVANGIVDSLTSSNKLEDYVSGLELPSVMQGQIVPPRALNGGGSIFTDGDIERLVNGITSALAFNDSEERTPVIIDGRTVAEIVTKHQRRMERGYA